MIANFLKIAGVDTEEEFYKKYPTEEAFMAKYGKIVKAQMGHTAQVNSTQTPQTQPFDFMGATNIASSVFDGIRAIGAEKEKLKEAKQTRMVTDAALRAQRSDNSARELAEMRESTYVRPEDNIVTGEELFPIYGTGTNVLAKKGLMMSNPGKGKKKSSADAQAQRMKDNVENAMNNIQGDRTLVYGNYDPKYFTVKDQGINYVISPSASNPQNPQGFKSQMRELAKLNPNARFDPQYLDFASRKNGGMMKYQQGGFMNFMDAGGSNILQGVTNSITDNSGGAQIGRAAGDAVKMIPGVGPVAGAIAGPALEMLGHAAFSWKNQNRISKEQEKTDRNIDTMTGINFGKQIQKNFNGFLKDGGMLQSDLKPLWGGDVETMSYNPFAPGDGTSGMITGKSHAKGGVGLQYGNNPKNVVEAEGQEPVIQIPDKMENGGNVDSVAIMGNLPIPKSFTNAVESTTGEKIKGGKFKTFIKNVGEMENKQNKAIKRNVDNSEKYSPLNSLDRISLNTIKLNIDKVHTPKLEALQDAKEGAALLQESINATAAERGLDATALAKGEVKKAKYGKKMKAQDGTSMGSAKAFKNVSRDASGLFGGVDADAVAETQASNLWYDFSDFDPTNSADVLDFQKAYNARTTGRKVKEDGKFGPQTQSLFLAPVQSQGVISPDPLEIEAEGISPLPQYTPVDTPEKKGGGFPWLDIANMAMPLLRNTDAEPFNNRQLYPELWALSNNALEPVEAQKFTPNLRSPYRISRQADRNNIVSGTRRAERMAQFANNPGALAALKAEEYNALQNVNQNEFIANQQFADQIYRENMAKLDDAELKNLAILDTQYERQAQARANTKATNFEAIKSISDKIAKHSLENKTLRVWENMYDYRYDSQGRAWYQGPLADFNDWEPISATDATTDTKEWDYVYDKDGKPIMKRQKQQGVPTKRTIWDRRGSGAPGLATPPFISEKGSIVKKYKKFK